MIANGAGLVWAHGGGFAGGDLDMPEADGVARAARGARSHGRVGRLLARAGAAGLGRDRFASTAKDGVHYPAASDDIVAAFALGARVGALPRAVGARRCERRRQPGDRSHPANAASTAALHPALVVLAYPTLLAVQPEPDADLRAALDADPEADTFGPDAVRGMYENYLGGPIDGAPLSAVPGTRRPPTTSRTSRRRS